MQLVQKEANKRNGDWASCDENQSAPPPLLAVAGSLTKYRPQRDHQGIKLIFAALALLQVSANGLQRFRCYGTIELRLCQMVEQFKASVAVQRIAFGRKR